MEADGMIDKYVGQMIEIIYLDRNNKLTQRKIHVTSIKEGVVKAFCLDQRAPRVFVLDRILAIVPVRSRAVL